MDVLGFRGLGYAVIGFLLVITLIVTFISMRKEAYAGQPTQGLLWLTVIVLGLCTLVALESAYLTAISFQNFRPVPPVSVNTADPQ